ncbi:MAG: hypothetical protein KAT71_01600 [Gammaproteobacteria bacterium]|nr:hypothetical protein [Gammaproteobacteria bacterium]
MFDHKEQPTERSLLIPEIVVEDERVSSDATTVMPMLSYPKIAREILKKGAVGFGTRLPLALGSFATSAMMASMGTDTLAASALISTTRNLFQVTACAMTVATALSAAPAKDKREIGVIVKQQYGITACVSAVAMPIMIFSSPILQLLGQEQSTADTAQDFLRGYALGFPFFVAINANNQIMLVTNRLESIASLFTQQGLAIGLGYILAFGEFGLPALGPQGLGYGSAIASLTTFAGYSLYMQSRAMFREYGIFSSNNKKGLSVFKDLLFKGLTIGVQAGSELLIYIPFTQIVAAMGETDLASTDIAIQYMTIASVPVLALTQASGILISGFIGKQQGGNAWKMGKINLLFNLVVPLTYLGLSLAIPRQLVKPFSDDSAVIDTAQNLLVLSSIGAVIDSVRFAAMGSLRGYKDMLFPALASIIPVSGISIASAYLLSYEAGLGAGSIFIGLDIGLTVAAGVMIPRWLYKSTTAVKNEPAIVNILDNSAGDSIKQPGVLNKISSYCCGFFAKKSSHNINPQISDIIVAPGFGSINS